MIDCRSAGVCVNGIDAAPETLPLFDLMAKLELPIWLHPARGADFPDYQKEKKSHYEIWWTFGWPYETSVAMGRLVFSGLFDRHPGLVIITHHLGAMIPFCEGRIGGGLDQLGARSDDPEDGGQMGQPVITAVRLAPGADDDAVVAREIGTGRVGSVRSTIFKPSSSVIKP